MSDRWCSVLPGKKPRKSYAAVDLETDVIAANQFKRSNLLCQAKLAVSWNAMVEGDTAAHLDSYAQTLIHATRICPHRYFPESQIKLFFDNNGMIGFAPGDVSPGDTIWELHGPDPLCIARENRGGYKTIAKSTTKPFTQSEVDGTIWEDRMFHCHLTFVMLPDEQ